MFYPFRALLLLAVTSTAFIHASGTSVSHNTVVASLTSKSSPPPQCGSPCGTCTYESPPPTAPSAQDDALDKRVLKQPTDTPECRLDFMNSELAIAAAQGNTVPLGHDGLNHVSTALYRTL